MPPPTVPTLMNAVELLQFEVALYSFSGMLRGGIPIAPGSHQAFYAAICQVATMLRTRVATPMHWHIALDIFVRMERIWDDGRDVAERDHLRSCISMAQEHLGIVNVDPAAMAATFATGSENPPSASSGNQNAEHTDATDLEIAPADPLPAPSASEEVFAIESLTSTVVVIQDEAECTICLEDITVECNVLEMPCKHIFHAPCLKSWLGRNRSCPLCRHGLETEAAPSVGATADSGEPAQSSTS